MLLSLNVAKSAGQVYQPVVIPLQDLKIECYCFSAAGCCVIFLFNSNEYLKLIWWVPLVGLSASSPYLLISPRLITILHDPALQAEWNSYKDPANTQCPGCWAAQVIRAELQLRAFKQWGEGNKPGFSTLEEFCDFCQF